MIAQERLPEPVWQCPCGCGGTVPRSKAIELGRLPELRQELRSITRVADELERRNAVARNHLDELPEASRIDLSAAEGRLEGMRRAARVGEKIARELVEFAHGQRLTPPPNTLLDVWLQMNQSL